MFPPQSSDDMGGTSGVGPGSGDQPPSPDRRRLLGGISVLAGTIGGLLAAIPFVGFLLSPLRRGQGQVWRPVGAANGFPIGATRKVNLLNPAPVEWAGYAGRSGAWLRRDGQTEFVAFSIYCTHTGCPIRWDDGSELFLCPCHGGVFYRDGSVAAGPPPAPLERHPVRIRDGIVEVQTIGLPTPAS